MPLDRVGQAGAETLETSLSHLPAGAVWSGEEIVARKEMVQSHRDALGRPLRWTSLGGIPIHDDIKLGRGNAGARIEAFKQTVRNLARHGVRRILINVMPLIDWVRTDIDHALPTGARTVGFDAIDLAAFDLHIIRRRDAEGSYDAHIRDAAAQRYAEMSDVKRARLEQSLTAGLPGGDSRQTRERFDALLDDYVSMGVEKYRQNMISFIGELCEVLEQEDALLAIHPDDPPWSICGLPRIATSLDDYKKLFDAVPSPANGILLCTGALGASPRNDIIEIARQMAHRVNYAHLRSVEHVEQHGAAGWSFRESEHLGGGVDLFEVASILVREEHRRRACGESALRCVIPYRADHGQRILDDLDKTHGNPGYTPIGMTKATAELRGMLYAIERCHRDSDPTP